MREKIKKITPDFIKEIYKKLRYACITALFCVFRILPVDKKKVALSGVWGYGDNTAAVAESLVKSVETGAGHYRNISVYYITKHTDTVPKGKITAVKDNSLKSIKVLATAGIWVDCNHKEGYIRKRKGQFYIQTWHGGIALKKIEHDVPSLGKKYLMMSEHDNDMVDLYISNSDFCTQMYKRAFMAKCGIIAPGSPRNDIFVIRDDKLDAKAKMEFLKKQKICSYDNSRLNEKAASGISDIKVALYAPTYRSDKNYNYMSLDLKNVKKEFEKKYGGIWLFVLKLHPLVSAALSESLSSFINAQNTKEKFVFDASSSGDLYEILRFSDILITDYSNTMFEFALAGRPVFLYADDVKAYSKERGMYFNYADLPFPEASDAEELINNIAGYEPAEYVTKQQDFLKKCGISETGHAAQKIVDIILSRIED